MFIKIYQCAKTNKDKHLENFTREILEIYEKYNIDGHIDWNK